MTRSHGRCRKGERLRMGFPHGHRKTTTLVAGLRMSGMVAPMVLDGPINGDWFEAYVTKVLVSELKPGDIVVMDNLSSHKRGSSSREDRSGGANLAVPSSIQPGLQSNRKGLCPAQGHVAQGRRTNRLRPLDPDRQTRRYLPAR
jgi:transposase